MLTLGILGIFIIDLIFGTRRKLIIGLASWVILMTAAFLFFQYVENSSMKLFSGLLLVDRFSVFFKFIFITTTLFIIFIVSKSKEFKGAGITEIIVFLLTTTLGMMMLSSAIDLLMIYIAIETVSLISYVLVGYKRGEKPSSEAALKYVIFGGVASGIMIFGMSYLYGIFGTTNLFQIKALLAAADVATHAYPLIFATLLIIIGLGFKIAMVPVHMWCPDVYEGAPTPITAFLSIAPKAAGFSILIRFIFILFDVKESSALDIFTQIKIPELFMLFSILTMTLGNLAAITQNNLKRLLAYSSIAHAGYLLMGLAAFNEEGIKAILFYLPIYLFMNLGAFLVVIAVRDATGSEDISAYRDLGKKNPYLAVSMAVFLFSLTGLPPLAGFLGKFYIFAAVIEKQLYILATIGVLNSVISLFYYARIVKAMFLAGKGDDTTQDISVSHLTSCNLYNIMTGILVAGNVLLIFYFSPLLKIVKDSVLTFF